MTPPINPTYLSNMTVEVKVTSKLTTWNNCPNNNCLFTYMNVSNSPNITSLSTTSAYGWHTVYINGSGFVNGFSTAQDCKISFRSTVDNKITVLNPISCNDTHTSVLIPLNLTSANYYLSVKNGYGDSSPKELLVKWRIGALKVSQGSIEGGYNSFYNATGHPLALDNNYQIQIRTANKSLPLV